MKHLIEYIKECGEGASTPSNTLGMGNPVLPTDSEPGSEPFTDGSTGKAVKQKTKRRKSVKKVSESTFEAINDIRKLSEKELEHAAESLYACTGAKESNFKKYKDALIEAIKTFSVLYSDGIIYYEGDSLRGEPAYLMVTDLNGINYKWNFAFEHWMRI